MILLSNFFSKAAASHQRHTWLAYACIVQLPFIIYLPALLGLLSANPIYWMSMLAPTSPEQTVLIRGFPGWVDGNAGVTTQALGHLAAEDWLHGIVPWWNPLSGIGLPLAAEMQCSALFLPFVLLLHFSDGILYLKICLHIMTGIFTFALLRQLGIGRRAALAGALLMEFNGTLAWFSHGPIMPTPFLPMLLFAIEKSYKLARDGKTGGWPLIGIAIAFSITAGFPETAFLDGLLGLTLAMHRIATFGSGPGRWHLARKIAWGGIIGLLLSAPAWLAFLKYLPDAYVSVHTDFSTQSLMNANYAMLLLPYIYGPLLFGPEMLRQQADIWWHNGGYCDLLLVYLATLALIGRGGRARGLRWLLAAWLAITIGKAADLPFLTAALNLIPFIKQTMFYVYITPSWEICLIILACLELDDWHRGIRQAVWRIRLAAIVCVGAALAAIYAGRADISLLAHRVSGYILFPLACTSLALAAIAVTTKLLERGPTRRRSVLLCGIIVGNCLVLFAVPLLSGTRAARLDLGPVAFLRDRLGLSRFYSMSVLQANYGAYFGIASVNHIYLPVPQSWVNFLHENVNATMDGVTFFGSALIPGPGRDDRADSIKPPILARDVMRTYETLGVRYVAAPAGTYPFTDTTGPAVTLADNVAIPLDNAQSFSVTFPAGEFKDGMARSVGLDIATYFGAANGVLQVSVCNEGICAEGAVDISGATDNAVVWIALDRPIAIHAGRPVTLTANYTRASHRMAVWLWPAQSPPRVTFASSGTAQAGLAPLVALRFEADGPKPALVYHDETTDIYQLADPEDYFSTLAGHCRLRPVSRTEVSANCTTADTLVRRELFFPGWTANADITPYDTIFQSVKLHQGDQVIHFTYQPPGIVWGYGAMLLGLLALAGGPARRTMLRYQSGMGT